MHWLTSVWYLEAVGPLGRRVREWMGAAGYINKIDERGEFREPLAVVSASGV